MDFGSCVIKKTEARRREGEKAMNEVPDVWRKPQRGMTHHMHIGLLSCVDNWGPDTVVRIIAIRAVR